MAIDTLLNEINSKKPLPKLERFDYTQALPYTDALKLAEAVGRSTIPNFVIDSYNTFAYENFAKWLVGDTTMECINPYDGSRMRGSLFKGLYIAGGTGTGKTALTKIMRYVGERCGLKVKEWGKEKTLRAMELHATSLVTNFIETGDYLNCADTSMFSGYCIQDLGVESREAIYMGNRQDVMRDFLETMGDNDNTFLIITSNYPMTHKFITERYGDRVASRLIKMCNYIEMRGADRRH